MHRIYASACELVNRHPWAVKHPSYYNPAQSQLVLNGTFDPLFDRFTEHIWVHARLPLHILLTMFTTRVPFDIVNDYDVLDMYHCVVAYLQEIEESAKINPDTKKYYDNMTSFRTGLMKSVNRVLNLHPEWKDKYTGMSRGSVLEILNRFTAGTTPSTTALSSLADNVFDHSNKKDMIYG